MSGANQVMETNSVQQDGPPQKKLKTSTKVNAPFMPPRSYVELCLSICLTFFHIVLH